MQWHPTEVTARLRPMRWARPLLRIEWFLLFVLVLGTILFVASSVIAIPGADAIKGWKYFGWLALGIIVLPVTLGMFLAYKSAMMTPESLPPTGEQNSKRTLRNWVAIIVIPGIVTFVMLYIAIASNKEILLVVAVVAITYMMIGAFEALKDTKTKKAK